MKKVEAIVRPEKVNEVLDGLYVNGFKSVTIYEVQGRGKQGGLVEFFRGKGYKIDFIPKIKIEIFVNDQDLDKVVDIILEKAYTGAIGDGKIFVSDVQEIIRIRTRERGSTAV